MRIEYSTFVCESDSCNACLFHNYDYKQSSIRFGKDRMNTFEVCKAVCHLSESIVGAGIIVDNKLVAMDAKPDVPVPNDDKFEKIFFQTSLIANIMIGNSDFFGHAKYFTLHFQNADLFFFLLLDYGIQGVLAVQVLQQHDHEQIVARINAFLSDSM